MMALPFLTVAAGMAAAAGGRSRLSLALWIASLAILLVLFRLHATDPLDLQF